ncbi:pentapeptide repeat-containing protein [Iamia sp.]|uniref:pentapeptide repeat-containing protein n=1 Tax=Iamia sp. TaxID=2722710 RepID=UPI002B893A60|nr:pentapeptide repeat-containing protein [Iamia sp.]HXH57388.1 pentapeptide repeat-containing protein [Iamia sp.]
MAGRRWEGWGDEAFACHREVEVLQLHDEDEHGGLRALSVEVVDGEAADVVLTDLAIGGTGLVGAVLTGLQVSDALVAAADLAGVRWPTALLQRVELRGARLTGADLTDIRLHQVRARECRFDSTVLSGAQLRDVVFEDCTFSDAFLGGSRLERVRFVRCDLSAADLDGARLDDVDLRSSRIDGVRRLADLRGAVVDPAQVRDVAERLAHQVGLVVEPELDPPEG